jgi:hypothetical protein
LALLPAACASPQDWKASPRHYRDYHHFIMDELLSGMAAPSWADMPDDVKKRLATCYADWAVANVTPAQLKQLDAAARGEVAAPAELMSRVDRQMKEASGTSHRGDFSILVPYCPEDIPTFQKYVVW